MGQFDDDEEDHDGQDHIGRPLVLFIAFDVGESGTKHLDLLELVQDQTGHDAQDDLQV